MRAKSGQIVCERQKGETTGARATVMSFAKTTTFQSHTNTNHHPAAYCQVSVVLNLHIQILREVSAWSILSWEPGQPKQSCSGAASQKTLRVLFIVRCCWKRALYSRGSFTSRVPPHSCPVLSWSWTKWKLSGHRYHWNGLMVSSSVQIRKGCTILTRLNLPHRKTWDSAVYLISHF